MPASGYIRSARNQDRRAMWVGLSGSIAIHLAAYGTWLLAAFVIAANPLLKEANIARLLAEAAEREARQEPPLIFVEVAPEQAAADPPPDTPYYSAVSSKAANPDEVADSAVPRVDGEQDKITRTFDTLNPATQTAEASPPEPEDTPPVDSKPSEPQPDPEPQALTEADTPKPPLETGDLALSKPKQDPPVQNRPRPRTLVEAKMQKGLLAGEKMKQDGGVRKRAQVSLDVKGTPFGYYDQAIVAAIQKRWYDLLDDSNIPPRAGRVVIEFRLHADGRISNLKVLEQDVGDILSVYCRRAISDPAPFAPWPQEMRRMIGKEYRDVKFTFYYL